MKKERKQQQFYLIGHFMIIDGKEVEIDPLKKDLPDRCLLAIGEMTTRKKCELIDTTSTKEALINQLFTWSEHPEELDKGLYVWEVEMVRETWDQKMVEAFLIQWSGNVEILCDEVREFDENYYEIESA